MVWCDTLLVIWVGFLVLGWFFYIVFSDVCFGLLVVWHLLLVIWVFDGLVILLVVFVWVFKYVFLGFGVFGVSWFWVVLVF